MTDTIQNSSLIVKHYIAKPPEFHSVEVTRENYDLVGEWLHAPEIITKRSGGVVWEVTFRGIYATNSKGEEVDELIITFRSSPDSKHQDRYFIVKDEKYISRVVKYGDMSHKYIEIPQEESVID